MFISIQINNCRYVTSTTMLIFCIAAIEIDTLVPSVHGHVNTRMTLSNISAFHQ